MPYERNVWERGDRITSAKLNNIESGLVDLEAYVDAVAMDLPTLIPQNIKDGAGKDALVEGNVSVNDAPGYYAHAEGSHTEAPGDYAHAEGYYAVASGNAAHAEGMHTTASENCAHAEGRNTTATRDGAHAEGRLTNATGNHAHAEGWSTTASNYCAHSEGKETIASGYCAHAEGMGTVANHKSQHVIGEYNVADANEAINSRGVYAEIVGNGTADNARSNARTLDWSGNEALAGSLTLGKGTEDEITIEPAEYAEVCRAIGSISELEAGSLSAIGASDGDVPKANGDGTWTWTNFADAMPVATVAKTKSFLGIT